MFGILEAVAVPHAGVFASYEELIKDLNGRMEKEGYKIVKARSHRSRMGGADVPGNEIVRCDLVCDRGGRPYKCMATKHKTTTKKTDCPWKAKAVNRKSIGGWVLTIACDQHNHAPGTPEPLTPTEASEDEENMGESVDSGNLTSTDGGPRLDSDTATAIQLAGIPESTLRLTGDTFHQLKTDYRKMSQPDRLNALAQLQLKLAAIYAVQNEDWQRQRRQEVQDKRHQVVERNRKQLTAQKQRARRQQRQIEQVQQQDAEQQQQPAVQLQHQHQHHHHQHQQQHQQPHPHPQQHSQQHPQQHQLQPDTQAGHLHQLMQEPHFQLTPNPAQAQVPLPGMTMPPQFQQQFPGPPKRIRGHRPSLSTQTDGQIGQ